LLAIPPTVTSTFPVVAPLGTVTWMLVELQLVALAFMPLNVTLLDPCDDPKLTPVTVTGVPAGPELGFRLIMLGAEPVPTVKFTPLLATPFTVTTTLPDVAPLGTGTLMLVLLQPDGDAVVPLKVTVLVPWLTPKLVPVIVMEVPTAPEFWLNPVIDGPAAVTVKVTPLLATPPTVTTTLPVVAPLGTGTVMPVEFHDVGEAPVPLKVTVLEPWLAPNAVPVIVTAVPIDPDVGVRLVMVGVLTVKVTPLLAVPFTVTTTLPVVAPPGTGTTMLVALQLVGPAFVPLNETVLDPWLAPKPVPVIVTEVPTDPDVGLRLAMW
jgi:hypothetical protein